MLASTPCLSFASIPRLDTGKHILLADTQCAKLRPQVYGARCLQRIPCMLRHFVHRVARACRLSRAGMIRTRLSSPPRRRQPHSLGLILVIATISARLLVLLDPWLSAGSLRSCRRRVTCDQVLGRTGYVVTLASMGLLSYGNSNNTAMAVMYSSTNSSITAARPSSSSTRSTATRS